MVQSLRTTSFSSPVKIRFISGTFALAVLYSLLPWGRLVGVPDLLALMIIFWVLHQPHRVGMFLAFVLGMVMDLHQTGVLGVQACAYVVLAYATLKLSRRMQRFPVGAQALHVGLLVCLAQGVPVMLYGLLLPPFQWDPQPLWVSFSTALLWPLVCQLLFAFSGEQDPVV